MRILFDYQIFTNQKFGGISRYFFEIIKNFQEGKNAEPDIPILLSNNHYLSKYGITKYHNFFPKIENVNKKRFMTLINRMKSVYFLKKRNYDIFHPTYYNPYFLDHIGNKPFVLTVFDMINEKLNDRFPHDIKLTERKKILIEKASKIIAISESTKRDVMDLFGTEESKIEVIYLANSLVQDKIKETNLIIPEKFILFVGSRYRYKNFITFIKSVSGILKKNKGLKVFCAGGGAFSKKELELFSELDIKGRMIQRNISDAELVGYYKNAELFVFPSLYEGFGIPVLESFACSCPLVCSDCSSLPEIAEDGGMYFDPYDKESMENAIDMVLNDSDLRNGLIKRGYSVLKKFSWQKTSDQTLNLYKKVLKNGRMNK